MARRRMIDPNIWASEDMAKLTIRQRLLVIGLFSNADDHGKGIAKPAYIRSTVFPYDDIPINEIIDDLETIRAVISIEFYIVQGNSYYRFASWLKWQTVQKPQPSIIPDPVENDSGMSPEPFSPKGKEGKGKEVGKEGKGIEMPALDSDSRKDHILNLINQCEIREYNHNDLDNIYSFLDVVDLEVIEAAIKKSRGKTGSYINGTIKGFMKDGITKAEHIRPLQVVKGGKSYAESESGHAGRTNAELDAMSF